MIESLELLRSFPSVLESDEKQRAIGTATAEQGESLFRDLRLLNIFNSIDTLDEQLLDILAYDFKIDWWDSNASIDKKRQSMKEHWRIHMMLGTPKALKLAIDSYYDQTELLSWIQYGGVPFHFKLKVNTDANLPNYNDASALFDQFKYYVNVRSKFDGIEFTATKTAKIYYGAALQNISKITMDVPDIDPTNYTWLTDENDNYLIDEQGLLLFE